eukprot:6212011-Pleurochrysis_carterae.AAC.2
MLGLRPIATGVTTYGRHLYGAPLRSWRRVAARQCSACFKAPYHRQNELTIHHIKQTVANDYHPEKDIRN